MRYVSSLKALTRSALYFFSSQDFADGLRITLSILIPSLIFAYFDQFKLGSLLSLGAICVSLTDVPGPIRYKRNAMLLCNLLLFIVALVTGFAKMNPFSLGAVIMVFSFFFSMFNVYGARAASVGSAALLVMVLMMGKQINPGQVAGRSALIAVGGLWYLLICLVFSKFKPYRPAQRILGECIRETARFLKLKASFYQIEVNRIANYRKLVAQQIVVNEKQIATREILFKTRQIVKDENGEGRILVVAFVEVVDIFDRIMASYYDYTALRERFGKTGVLEKISELMQQLALELKKIGNAVLTNSPYTQSADPDSMFISVKTCLDELEVSDKTLNTLILKKILVNIRDLYRRVQNLGSYFGETEVEVPELSGEEPEYPRFLSRQVFDPVVFRDNLTLSSSVCRHSIRVMLACIAGYTLTYVFPGLQYSYWILLTIIVILKPGFSLTRQRNYQRLLGTLFGGTIGVFILIFVKDKIVEFCFLMIFMLGGYSFRRRNYIVSIILMTPYLLILFNFLGGNFLIIAEERVIDTFIGSGIAIAASYLIFPSWESTQLQGYMQKVLNANCAYLQKLSESLEGENVSDVDYKLARKEVFVHSANLSAACQRMLSEPKSKRRNQEEANEFVVLNHILSSNISTVAAGLRAHEPRLYPAVFRRCVNSSLAQLYKSLEFLGGSFSGTKLKAGLLEPEQLEAAESADDPFLAEQLAFIYKLTEDIGAITDTFLKNRKQV